jgi:hypothetical protein
VHDPNIAHQDKAAAKNAESGGEAEAGLALKENRGRAAVVHTHKKHEFS